jgi:hypothetical protein
MPWTGAGTIQTNALLWNATWRAASSTSQSVSQLNSSSPTSKAVHQTKKVQHDIFWLSEAQMNCHANNAWAITNWLVTTGLICQRLSCLSLQQKLPFPLTGAAIMRNIAHRLHQAVSSPPALQKHIMSKNDWIDWIFISIDWDTQAKASSTTLEHTQELFATKGPHNPLPTR